MPGSGMDPSGRSFDQVFDVRRVSMAIAVLVVICTAAVWGINMWLGPAPGATQVQSTANDAPAPAAVASQPAPAPTTNHSPAVSTQVPQTTAAAEPPKPDRFARSPRRPEAPLSMKAPPASAAPAAERRTTPRPTPQIPSAAEPQPTVRATSAQATADTAIYSSRDADVTPPVILWPQQLGRIPDASDQTMIEVVVNADGTVAQAKAQESPRTLDDAMVMTMSLSAAKSWIFRPAYKDGRPVRYRQLIPVSVR